MICSRCKCDKSPSDFKGKTCNTCRTYWREYYNTNRKECIERSKKQIKNNREKVNIQKRNHRRKNPVTDLLCGVRQRCKRDGIPYNITREDIVVPDYCPALGIPLKTGDGHASHNSPSIDRLIPELGYVKGNVHVISHKANTMKSDATLDELRNLVKFLEGLHNETAGKT